MDYKAEYEIMKQQLQEANESSRHFQGLLESAEAKNAVLAKQLKEGGLITPSMQELNAMAKSLKELTDGLALFPSDFISKETKEIYDKAFCKFLNYLIEKFS